MINLPPWARAASKLLPRMGALAGLGAAAMAAAQTPPAAPTTVTLGATALTQLDADLDGGGRVGWNAYSASVGVTHQFNAAMKASVTATYATEDWRFDTPTVFGPGAPWGRIQRPSIGFNFSYASAPDLIWFVAPQVQWAYESGASAADGVNYGAVFGATKIFSPTLAVGFGLSVFRQIDDTRYFPFLIVNWQISDKLRLGNPLPAGPAGGAGLELAYAIAPQWELAGGASYRDYRFRLDDEGVAPEGLGRNSGIPVFARLTRTFGPAARIDLYAGLVANGKLRLLDENGGTLRSTNYGTAPLLAITGSFSF